MGVSASQFTSLNANIALNDWSVPPNVYAILLEVLVKVYVPKVTVVSCDYAQRVLVLLVLSKLNTTLATSSQVITVGEVKAIAKVLLEFFNVSGDALTLSY